MILGEARTFPDVRADETQALKPPEEAAEALSARESWTECSGSADQMLEEAADCITACCNLAAALGCDCMRPHLQEDERRDIKGGAVRASGVKVGAQSVTMRADVAPTMLDDMQKQLDALTRAVRAMAEAMVVIEDARKLTNAYPFANGGHDAETAHYANEGWGDELLKEMVE